MRMVILGACSQYRYFLPECRKLAAQFGAAALLEQFDDRVDAGVHIVG